MKRTLFLLLLLALGGGWLIAGAGPGPSRAHVTSAGVPLEVVRPAGDGPHPGVVVAHGFSGSATLMAPFGDTLAARGYVVVLLDFAGHGASTRQLPDQAAGTDESTEALQRDLSVAVAHLRSLPDVDASRVALVGHSMGAGAVTRYAAAHPDVTATVAISLPDAVVASAERPARLLTIAGALEFPGFREVATDVAAQRDDRAVRIVPGVEHITVLYAPQTHRETVAWLDRAFGGPRTDGAIPFPGRRLAGTVLLVLAFVLAFPPFVAQLAGTTTDPRRPARPEPVASRLIGAVRVAAVTAVAAGAGAVAARFLPTAQLPLAVAGYVIGYAAVTGALLLAYAAWRPTIANRPAPVTARPRLLLTVPYAVLAIVVPVHLGMTHALPVGDRWWLLPIVWAAFALLAFATERVTAAEPLRLLAVAAVVVVVLAAAAVVGLTHGFVTLALFPLVGLMLWQALWSFFLNRSGVATGFIAVTGSVVVAWPLAVALPLSAS
ncbi:S9 family peptidase [Actinoplanes sp. DH11]|uniref:alpha/beta hydrolase family protein n=1 Tax=Actinoplanes sp. DH11 TaxID=2857011 RepID=UPI001E41377E|nr:alpha/beta fold hydrolase [Actinoplanes sp. DH11]